MPRISMVALLAVLLMSCGASLKHSRDAQAGKAGLTYCEAKKSKNTAHMTMLAKKHRLNTEDWDSYCDAMEKQNYSTAHTIAQRKKLGSDAERKAGLAYAWHDIENGYVFPAYMTLTNMKMSDSDRHAFATTVFAKFMASRKCIDAIEVARIFSLSKEKHREALTCIEKDKGPTAALVYACINATPPEVAAAYKKRFLKNLPAIYTSKARASDFEDAVRRCDWNQGDLAGLLIFLRKVGDIDLLLETLKKLRLYLPEKEMHLIARSLFDQFITGSKPEDAEKIQRAYPKALDGPRKKILLNIFLSRLKCPEALAFAHKEGMDDVELDGIFTAPRCTGSEFDNFAWVLSSASSEVWKKYFFLAVKHKRFVLARSLVGNAMEKSSSDINLYLLLVDEALKANAHGLLLGLNPPLNEDQQAYKDRIFEHALDNNEEWIAATYANEHHSLPPSIVERAYLRAMERGEIILGAQIAKTYGDPKKLESRARLAFEMAMLAKKPKDAQFIMQVTGLKDSERHRRAALLLFRQKRDADNKAYREKKRRERKRKRDSGEWSVTRD